MIIMIIVIVNSTMNTVDELLAEAESGREIAIAVNGD